MNPRITNRKQLLALDWPDDVPVLVGEDVDGYTESLGRNRHNIWEWMKIAWGSDTPEQRQCFDQFAYVLYEVMGEHCDPRDRGTCSFANVPTTPNHQVTKAPYSPDEVAEWWNEALRRVGYEI
jgi:hypothetical protein